MRLTKASRANQEKYFYAALIKHREENLENYYGGGDAMSHSASDYQHAPRDPADTPPMPQGKQQSQSQYSIMNDEHLRSSRTFAENPSSASSYDPYRPSRYRMTPEGTGPTKVTVHRRGESNGTRKAHMQHSLRHANANRIEALRRGGRTPSNSALSKHSSHRKSMSRSSLVRASTSRHSITSSVWPSSPPVAVTVRAAITSHKRGVSFSHLRQSSTTSALPKNDGKSDPYTPELQAKAKFSQQRHANSNVDPHGSPSVRADTAVRSRKERTTASGTRPRTRKSTTPNQINKGDIRQASSELERACEEAFFRSSISSSDYTSTTDKHAPYDTPPSSVSNRDSGHSRKNGMSARPLPSLPAETPNTFIARTLEETRVKLAARSAAEGTNNSAKFEEVLATLEKIMPIPGEAEAEARRITSAPDSKPVDSMGFLPIISEEGRGDNKRSGHRYRSVTAPVHKDGRPSRDLKTVRMVPPSSPVPPPTVRRHTGEPRPYRQSSEETTKDTNYLSVPGPDPRLLRKKSDDSVMIHKDAPIANGDDTLVKKKPSWFRRWKEPQPSSEEAQLRTRVPQAWGEPDDRSAPKSRTLVRDKQPAPLDLVPTQGSAPKSSASSEFPMRRSDESKGFTKWFRMGRGDKKEHEKSPGTAELNQSFFSTSPPSPLPASTPTSTGEPTTRSWFARFLRLRPETRTLAYNVPRARTRQELFRLLREWQRHGIQDLVYFPQENAITARVDKINSLDIKPVVFRIELFVVLQNGRKAGLSLARCQQVRGAASSFRKVVEVLESVSRERGLLVEDEEKRRELCEIVN